MLYFIYNNDELVGFKYNGNTYHYHKNLFGDVIGIYDSNNNEIVTYEYDSWGAPISVVDTSSIGLATINPFRYRSYYYDEETKLYYLNSRYYNPVFSRFINVDNQVLGIGGQPNGYNLYMYCLNNPINLDDDRGNWPKWTKKLVAGVAIVAVVAAVAAITVATAGTGTLAASIAVGAAKGAAIGLATGAVGGAISGAVSHRVSTGSWDGSVDAALEGLGSGALSGAATGALFGGISGALTYNPASYGDSYNTYSTMKKYVGPAGDGKDWHHIVEQGQINKSNFDPGLVQNTKNIVALDKNVHAEITRLYSKKGILIPDKILRNVLTGKSYTTQYMVGKIIVGFVKIFK